MTRMTLGKDRSIHVEIRHWSHTDQQTRCLTQIKDNIRYGMIETPPLDPSIADDVESIWARVAHIGIRPVSIEDRPVRIPLNWSFP